MFRQVGEVFHVKHCVMDFTIASPTKARPQLCAG
jgi:hypothetical protein